MHHRRPITDRYHHRKAFLPYSPQRRACVPYSPPATVQLHHRRLQRRFTAKTDAISPYTLAIAPRIHRNLTAVCNACSPADSLHRKQSPGIHRKKMVSATTDRSTLELSSLKDPSDHSRSPQCMKRDPECMTVTTNERSTVPVTAVHEACRWQKLSTSPQKDDIQLACASRLTGRSPQTGVEERAFTADLKARRFPFGRRLSGDRKVLASCANARRWA